MLFHSYSVVQSRCTYLPWKLSFVANVLPSITTYNNISKELSGLEKASFSMRLCCRIFKIVHKTFRVKMMSFALVPFGHHMYSSLEIVQSALSVKLQKTAQINFRNTRLYRFPGCSSIVIKCKFRI